MTMPQLRVWAVVALGRIQSHFVSLQYDPECHLPYSVVDLIPFVRDMSKKSVPYGKFLLTCNSPTNIFE